MLVIVVFNNQFFFFFFTVAGSLLTFCFPRKCCYNNCFSALFVIDPVFAVLSPLVICGDVTMVITVVVSFYVFFFMILLPHFSSFHIFYLLFFYLFKLFFFLSLSRTGQARNFFNVIKTPVTCFLMN